MFKRFADRCERRRLHRRVESHDAAKSNQDYDERHCQTAKNLVHVAVLYVLAGKGHDFRPRCARNVDPPMAPLT
jgi:hypothetical protein